MYSDCIEYIYAQEGKTLESTTVPTIIIIDKSLGTVGHLLPQGHSR